MSGDRKFQVGDWVAHSDRKGLGEGEVVGFDSDGDPGVRWLGGGEVKYHYPRHLRHVERQRPDEDNPPLAAGDPVTHVGFPHWRGRIDALDPNGEDAFVFWEQDAGVRLMPLGELMRVVDESDHGKPTPRFAVGDRVIRKTHRSVGWGTVVRVESSDFGVQWPGCKHLAWYAHHIGLVEKCAREDSEQSAETKAPEETLPEKPLFEPVLVATVGLPLGLEPPDEPDLEKREGREVDARHKMACDRLRLMCEEKQRWLQRTLRAWPFCPVHGPATLEWWAKGMPAWTRRGIMVCKGCEEEGS